MERFLQTKHLIQIDDLSRNDIEEIFSLAEYYLQLNKNEVGQKYRLDSFTQINVFFENNIFYKNHWPKDVLIQPKNNIILTENDLKKQFSGSNSYISNLDQNLNENHCFHMNQYTQLEYKHPLSFL